MAILVALEKQGSEFDDCGRAHTFVAVNRPAVKHLWGVLVDGERISNLEHVHDARARRPAVSRDLDPESLLRGVDIHEVRICSLEGGGF